MVRSLVVAALVATTGLLPPGAMAQTPRPRPVTRKPAATAPGAKPAPPATPATPAVAAKAAPPSDVTVVTSYTQGAQVSVNTTYLSDGRQRVEFPGLVSIGQCDLKRTVLVSPVAKRYRVQPDPVAAPPVAPPTSPLGLTPFGAEIAAAFGGGVGAESPLAGFVETGGVPIAPAGGGGRGMGAMGQMGAPPKTGLVTITTTLTDTLERQTMFGLEARRIKTTVTRQTTGDVCDKTPLRTEIDAWYVDLPQTASSCGRTAPATPEPPAASSDACQDRTDTRVVGDVTLGFPVKTVTTNMSGDSDKQESSTTTAEVTSLEISRLDPALFDVPAGYVEAKSALELAPALTTGSTLGDVLFGSTADGTSTATPKAAGFTRIGVLEPVNSSGRSSLKMRALRQELVAKFTKGSFEAVPLGGSVHGTADATRLECDYVLATEVTEVKTSKPGKLSGVSRMTGGGPPKDRQEVKMAFRLYPTDGTATIRLAGDVKADNGGGFSISSALRIAAFAGQLYMGLSGFGMMSAFGGMGGMGMGMGMVNPMFAMSRGGGMGAMGSTFFDPRSMAMSSMAMGFGGLGGMMGAGDPSDAEVQKVVSKALDDVVKDTTDKLKSGK